MKIDVKGFMAVMRRATHSKFKTVLLNNRLILQCYNMDLDSEVGFHYVLPIPETDEYQSDFYDLTVLLNPSEIISTYNQGHKLLTAEQKKAKAKTADINEELYFTDKEDGTAELKFLYFLKDELISSISWETKYPVDEMSPDVENIVNTYNQLLDRIRVGGACLVFNGNRYDLCKKVQNCPEIYYFIVRYHKKKIRVPLMKSMFGGIKETDRFLFSIQESVYRDDIYIYSIQYERKGITEQYWGYLLNY